MASTYKKSNKRCVTNFIYDFLIILNELQFENIASLKTICNYNVYVLHFTRTLFKIIFMTFSPIHKSEPY